MTAHCRPRHSRDTAAGARGVLRRENLALYAAVAEATRDDDAADPRKHLVGGLLREQLGIDPANLYVHLVGQAACFSDSLTDR